MVKILERSVGLPKYSYGGLPLNIIALPKKYDPELVWDTEFNTGCERVKIDINCFHHKEYPICHCGRRYVPLKVSSKECYFCYFTKDCGIIPNMPIHKVKGGFKWGKSGKVYKSKAGVVKQMRAIYASGYKKK